MEAKQLFLERYEGFREYPVHLVEGLSEEQLRHSPNGVLNPICWTIWHIARCEDVAVNRLLADRPQVFSEGNWLRRLCAPRSDVGTGMSKAEVEQLCTAIDIRELKLYLSAVVDRTRSVVAALPSRELSAKLSTGMLRRVLVEEGAGGPQAEAIAEAYDSHTKGWLLGHLALTHSYYHIGQAFGVRALLGAGNPW